MPIPDGITTEHVLKALQKLDQGVTHPFKNSVVYALEQGGKRYPPKAVVSLAAAEISGTPLHPKDLRARQAKKLLRNLGFKIARKTASVAGSPWDAFIAWAKKFREYALFEVEERTSKIKIAESLQDVKFALAANNPDWSKGLVDLLSLHTQKKWLLDWRVCEDVVKHVRGQPDDLATALHKLWGSEGTALERLRNFMPSIPTASISGLGTRLSVGSFFQFAADPLNCPPYRSDPFDRGYKLTGYPPSPKGLDEAGEYEYSLGFLDTIIEESAKRGLKLQDRLDAQCVLWCVTKRKPLEVWSAEEQQAFLVYQNGGDIIPPDTELESLAKRLLIDVMHLVEIKQLLEDKGQVIFYGPPGTGKTYIARELAQHFAGTGGSVEIVQFHPSYAYEDFVEGYRPELHNGHPGFSLIEGPLKRIAARAEEASDEIHVLLIDEINRGNIAKVFGELYYLLEYRDEEISLQYSRQPFSLPENLWIIGTMNTADRSIALIDAALRRRFYFVPFFPDQPPIAGLLRRWLAAHQPEFLSLADVVDRANQELRDRHAAIGPSHFLRDDLSEEWIKTIWRRSILPYLEEQFIGDEEQLKRFDLDTLKQPKSIPSSAEIGKSDATPGT